MKWKIGAVLYKEFILEFRNRTLLYTLTLFAVIVVLILAFALMESQVSAELFVAFCWLVLFFLAMQSGARMFTVEYERATAELLYVLTPALSVFWGKVLYHTILLLVLALLSGSLLFIVFDPGLTNIVGFWLYFGVSSVLIGSVIPVFSALVARARVKGALLPILAFPVFVPLMSLGIEGMLDSGIQQFNVRPLVLMIAYAGIVLTVAALLFDYLWRE